MPESTNREMISSETLKDIYIRKMIRILNNENDRWSLFSLHNNYGRFAVNLYYFNANFYIYFFLITNLRL